MEREQLIKAIAALVEASDEISFRYNDGGTGTRWDFFEEAINEARAAIAAATS